MLIELDLNFQDKFMRREFTATAYVIESDKVLLIFHRKLKKWLPPGGHLHPDELPSVGAKREVREETGLEISFINQDFLWVERWNAKSFERPMMCLLEEIPATETAPKHQHIDFIYLATPIHGTLKPQLVEVEAARWFTLTEVNALISDEEIFEETKSVIQKILDPAALPSLV